MFNIFKYRSIGTGLVVVRRRLAATRAYPPKPREHTFNVEVSRLPNGLRIVTDPTPSFMSGLAFYIQAGPKHENSCNNGITHVISHLLFKGTKSLPQKNIEQFCLDNGVRFDTHTYRDMLAMRAFFIDPNLAEDIFGIFATIINEFHFNKALIEAEKFNMCVEAVDYEYNPHKLVFDYLHQTAFQCTSMGQTKIGPSKIVQKIDAKMVSEFINRHFIPNNIVVSAAGNVEHNDMVCVGTTAFKRDAMDCVPSSYGSRFVSSDIRYRDDSMPYVHAAVAFEAPGYGHIDYLPMLMAKEMFGSWHKSQGRGINNRDLPAQAGAVDDLCVFYKSFYLAYSDVGLWGFYFVSDMLAADDMLITLQKYLLKMIIMCTKPDIDYGSLLAKIKLQKRRSNVYRRVHDNAVQVMYTNEVNQASDYSKQFQRFAIKSNYFTDVLDNYLYDRDTVSAAVGPVEALADMVRIRSGTWWYRY